MILKDIKFNDLTTLGLSIRMNYKDGTKSKWHTGCIGEVLREIPEEWAYKKIKETGIFFDEFVIELEE